MIPALWLRQNPCDRTARTGQDDKNPKSGFKCSLNSPNLFKFAYFLDYKDDDDFRVSDGSARMTLPEFWLQARIILIWQFKKS